MNKHWIKKLDAYDGFFALLSIIALTLTAIHLFF